MVSDIEIFLNQYITLPRNIIDIFEGLVEYVEFKPKEFLTKANEFSPHFYIIKSGIARSYLPTENGKEITRAFFFKGNTTGSNSATIKNNPSEVNYQALTEIKAYKGNLLTLKELATEHHEISKLYIKMLEKAYITAEKIIFDVATLTGEQRYLKLQQFIPDIDKLISQKDIASYLNVSTVQLSRIRKKLNHSKNAIL